MLKRLKAIRKMCTMSKKKKKRRPVLLKQNEQVQKQ